MACFRVSRRLPCGGAASGVRASLVAEMATATLQYLWSYPPERGQVIEDSLVEELAVLFTRGQKQVKLP